MYNRQWLQTQVASYIHDSSVTGLVDTWIDLGAKRVSQVLRCWEMERELTIGLAAVTSSGILDGGSAAGGGVIIDGGDAFNLEDVALPYMEIPDTTKEILGVQWLDHQSQWSNLVALSRHEARRYKASGTPQRYLVEARKIYPYPYQAGEYRAQIIDEVIIPPTADDEVAALSSYPFIFLNAALAEGFDWKQDEVMNVRYDSKWINEATVVANNYMEDRSGESLAMRSV